MLCPELRVYPRHSTITALIKRLPHASINNKPTQDACRLHKMHAYNLVAYYDNIGLFFSSPSIARESSDTLRERQLQRQRECVFFQSFWLPFYQKGPPKPFFKSCEIVNFGPMGPFCHFQKGPITHQKRKFWKIKCSSVLLCHTEPTYKKICFYLQNLKGPLNSSKSKIFKRNIFPIFLCHIEPAYQEIMSLCSQLCLLAFRN